MNDNLYGVQILKEYECGSFKTNNSVAPFSLFIFLFLFFLGVVQSCNPTRVYIHDQASSRPNLLVLILEPNPD